MKGSVVAFLAMVIGFGVGFAWGAGTRKAAPSHVKTSYDDGKVTITADVSGALVSGLFNYFDS